jgi:hypothetical protein
MLGVINIINRIIFFMIIILNFYCWNLYNIIISRYYIGVFKFDDDNLLPYAKFIFNVNMVTRTNTEQNVK